MQLWAVWLGDALKAGRSRSSEPSRTVEGEPPQQEEENTQRLEGGGRAWIRREGQQPGQLRSGSHGPTSLFLCPSLRCTAASPPPPLAR